MLLLLKRGIDVFPALVDDRGIDGVVRSTKGYLEVQIKSGKSWDTPRGISREICRAHPERVFIIYNYGENLIIVLTGRQILNEREWETTTAYEWYQLKWPNRLVKKYGSQNLEWLVQRLSKGSINGP